MFPCPQVGVSYTINGGYAFDSVTHYWENVTEATLFMSILVMDTGRMLLRLLLMDFGVLVGLFATWTPCSTNVCRVDV